MPELNGDLEKVKENIANEIPCMIVGTKYFFRFVVERDGSVSDIQILKGEFKPYDAECQASIKKAFASMPKWNAGEMSGKPVRVYYNLPIKKTQENNSSQNTIPQVKTDDKSTLYPSGKIECSYTSTGEIIFYYESGKIKGTGQVISPNGNKLIMDEVITKLLSGKGEFESWVWNGDVIMNYPTGNIKEKTNYKKGIPNDEAPSYFENGKLKSKTKFINGGETQEWTKWYENGNVKEKGTFIKRKKEGEWITYDESGNIKSKENYIGGVKQ
jgi:antitoxin component YwqK of YwqJK toxin-antitoxin module